MSETEHTLKTSWDDHYMYAAYVGFLRFALGHEPILKQYRHETGDKWEPGNTGIDQMIDTATGADFAFLQRFSDWAEKAHFGTPDDLEAA
jgi:hypothetical protein